MFGWESDLVGVNNKGYFIMNDGLGKIILGDVSDLWIFWLVCMFGVVCSFYCFWVFMCVL